MEQGDLEVKVITIAPHEFIYEFLLKEDTDVENVPVIDSVKSNCVHTKLKEIQIYQENKEKRKFEILK